MLLLLSCFSHVRLCATLWTAAHQASLSPAFSRQEYWSGLPFSLQCMKVKSESEVTHSYPTLGDPIDCSLPGSSVHGIFQARVLEWVAIASSEWEGIDIDISLLYWWKFGLGFHLILTFRFFSLLYYNQHCLHKPTNVLKPDGKMKKT